MPEKSDGTPPAIAQLQLILFDEELPNGRGRRLI